MSLAASSRKRRAGRIDPGSKFLLVVAVQFAVSAKKYAVMSHREKCELCPENGDFSGSQIVRNPENRELPCFFPCYQGNAHAETGSHADACATTLGFLSQIFLVSRHFQREHG
jgi:hypothetical protein